MKKIAVLLAVLMVIGAGPGWCGVSATLDTVIENRMNSDIHLVADAGRVLDLANRGVGKTYTTIMDPMEPVMDPVRKVRDEFAGRVRSPGS